MVFGVYFSNHHAEEETELVGLLYLCCGCLCSVSLPYCAMSWPEICDCEIS